VRGRMELGVCVDEKNLAAAALWLVGGAECPVRFGRKSPGCRLGFQPRRKRLGGQADVGFDEVLLRNFFRIFLFLTTSEEDSMGITVVTTPPGLHTQACVARTSGQPSCRWSGTSPAKRSGNSMLLDIILLKGGLAMTRSKRSSRRPLGAWVEQRVLKLDVGARNAMQAAY